MSSPLRQALHHQWLPPLSPAVGTPKGGIANENAGPGAATPSSVRKEDFSCRVSGLSALTTRSHLQILKRRRSALVDVTHLGERKSPARKKGRPSLGRRVSFAPALHSVHEFQRVSSQRFCQGRGKSSLLSDPGPAGGRQGRRQRTRGCSAEACAAAGVSSRRQVPVLFRCRERQQSVSDAAGTPSTRSPCGCGGSGGSGFRSGGLAGRAEEPRGGSAAHLVARRAHCRRAGDGHVADVQCAHRGSQRGHRCDSVVGHGLRHNAPGALAPSILVLACFV